MSTSTSTTVRPESDSNFDKVVEFNNVFGVTVHNTPQPNIFTTDPALVKLRLSLIEEEVRELKEAIDNHDMVETVDALADILYVVYGAGASFGVDLDNAFDIVHRSNMSKSCDSEKLAQETVAWYKENDDRYDTPDYRPAGEGKWVVFNRSTGKVLKSVRYTPADLKKAAGCA